MTMQKMAPVLALVAYTLILLAYVSTMPALAKTTPSHVAGSLLLLLGYGIIAWDAFLRARRADSPGVGRTPLAIAYAALVAFFLASLMFPVTPTLQWYDAMGVFGFVMLLLSLLRPDDLAGLKAPGLLALAAYYSAGAWHYAEHLGGGAGGSAGLAFAPVAQLGGRTLATVTVGAKLLLPTPAPQPPQEARAHAD